MIKILALLVVVSTGFYFMALGVALLLFPAKAKRFLLGFASSPLVHYMELLLRFLVGTALIISAPHMLYSIPFKFFGWALLVTTACLLLVPWQWHYRFAKMAVPRATRFIWLIGLSSLALGGMILAAVVGGSVA